MKMVSNGEFFKTKLFNFHQYCHTNLTDPKFQPLLQQINDVYNAKIENAITFFYTTIKPIGTQQYLAQVLQHVRLTEADFDPDHLTKIKAYIDCFLAIVNQ